MDTKLKQVTVEVPEDRVAEFHAFFARFLAGSRRRGRGGPYGRPHRGSHRGHRSGRCARGEHGVAGERGAADERDEAATGQQTDVSEV